MKYFKNNKGEKLAYASFEDASIMRVFTILFMVMSIMPTLVLWYFYLQFKNLGRIDMTETSFNVMLIFIVLGVLISYATMRKLILKVINLSIASRKALKSVLPPEELERLGSEGNELSSLSDSFNLVIDSLENNILDLEKARKNLHSIMAKVGKGISSMRNIDTFLELILETVTDAMMGDSGVLMLVVENEEDDSFIIEIKTVYGVDEIPEESRAMKIEKDTTFYGVIKSKKPLIVPNVYSADEIISGYENLFSTPMVCAPLVSHDKVHGLMVVSSGKKSKTAFSEEEMVLLFNLATQTAVAIENEGLNLDIERTYFETISALAMAVDAKDQYSRGHLNRVAEYSEIIAREMKLPEADIELLTEAARLHDIGKIGMPDSILKKQGPLTDEEYDIVKKHPEMGESIIKPVRTLGTLCDIVRHHHEFLDGTGYPDKLKGDQISQLVRITTVADIYDALTSDRPYRKKMTLQDASKILIDMNDKLDQDIVEIFIKSLSK
ncbi:HD domain-containing phosphohydrolase [Candidatus Omnitrophota bacterium]